MQVPVNTIIGNNGIPVEAPVTLESWENNTACHIESNSDNIQPQFDTINRVYSFMINDIPNITRNALFAFYSLFQTLLYEFMY